jgi:anti-anti-sigma factor
MAAETNERPSRSVPGTVDVSLAEPSYARVTLCGEWDISTQPRLAEALTRARARRDLLIDLSECSFLDSRTLGTLISLAHELASSGRRLEVALPPSQAIVKRAFAVLGAHEILSVHDTLEDAQRVLFNTRSGTRHAWLTPSPPMPVD